MREKEILRFFFFFLVKLDIVGGEDLLRSLKWRCTTAVLDQFYARSVLTVRNEAAHEVHPSRFSRIATALCSPFSRYGEGRTIKREIPYVHGIHARPEKGVKGMRAIVGCERVPWLFCAVHTILMRRCTREGGDAFTFITFIAFKPMCVVTGARARLPLDWSRGASSPRRNLSY